MLLQSFDNRIPRLVSSVLPMGVIACGVMIWRTRPAYGVDDPAAERAAYSRDISAQYILSIVYRRLGMKDEAAREAAIFADQKDDPMANSYALEYLSKHPEISSKSVPWHIHSNVADDHEKQGGGPGQ